MDGLDDLLMLAQISGSADIRCAFQGNWQVRHDAERGMALVHLITKGQCCLQIDASEQTHLLNAGDVVFLPRSQGHILRAKEIQKANFLPVMNTQEGLFHVKYMGDGVADTELFCARFEYEPKSTVLALLPDVIFLHLNDTPLHSLVALLQLEAQQTQVASRSALNALAQLLLTLLLRAYWQQSSSKQSGIGYVLQDKRLGKLIQAILRCPEDDWRIERLTQQVAISRAQLMRLFQIHLQCSPHMFVNRIRLQKAAWLLRHSQQTVLSIALATGFGSETHLGKAFKREYGQTPKQYRSQTKQTEDLNHAIDFLI